ncbi:MAG: potassium channel protein [Planctomycetia bacterium]|nr:potassium channel protein [Planctomycetia bacterium]
MRKLPPRLLLMFSIPLVLILFGTLGYYFIEDDYSLFDALYMTVITITTVGYGETHPLTTYGRIFTIVLLLVGVFSVFYAATEIVRGVVSGEVQEHFGRQRMVRALAALKNHLIVCGYGRMGKHVCREFARQRIPFVVVDRSADFQTGFDIPGGIALAGDATRDEILKEAGVDRARALVTVVPHDAENLYVTMSARLLNSKLYIVARAETDEAERKLMRAGADRVIAPYALGGSRIAQAVMRPTVLEFIDLATRTEHLELQIEQTIINVGSPLIGASLMNSKLRQDLGLIIVAIKKSNGTMAYTPPPETILQTGDTLIALGRRDQLDNLEQLAKG